jgi:2-octaprenyl-6-methoxyphenol hydroxylase
MAGVLTEHRELSADIAIAGGSFAGLALALAIARALGNEVKISVLEGSRPRTDSAQDPRAVTLSRSSRRMLDVLGVWPAIEPDAQPVTTIEISDSPLSAGVRPILLTYSTMVEAEGPAAFVVPAPVLEQRLREAVAAQGSSISIRAAQVASYAIGPYRSTVGVGSGESVSARLVVAADGRHSALRAAAGIKIVTWDYPQIGIIATVAHERPHGGRAVQHFLPAGPFAILPLTGNRSCITWTEDAERGREIMAMDEAQFLAEVERRFGGRLGALRIEGARKAWPLCMHLARAYVAPRLALVGDAAHGVHPLAGQGLNLALRDAAALAEVVVEAARTGLDIGNPESLRRYERWRRFDSTVLAATFDGLNRVFSNDSTLLRSAREFGLGLVDRVPALKRLLVEEAAGLTGELPKLLRGEPV